MKKKRALINDILKLDIPNRILLVEDIWDSIAAKPETLPITESQKTELDRRLAQHQKHPKQAISWETAERKILNRK